ncbi:transglycosylase domain-containing protein [Cryptosporangium phraense]|uniref:Penicillin-binding protein n=1 Tax=Cryptosporangium phraense TaxID=2593070 RepID=A0A545AE86_9ACTN|nr:transglycosylase domain-containing protein [Cryptosporangium phraense]TQS39657.1 penicillin-binding protein [Cryptosporangium phraense]
MTLDQPQAVTRSGDAPAPPPGPGDGTGAPEAPRRRRGLIGLVIVVVTLLVVGAGGSWAVYARTDLPAIPSLSETARIQYSDGRTFATFATEDRTSVPLGSVPKAVQDAVVAAQDPDFRDGGSTLGALARAAGTLVTGPDDHPSIAEQYVRTVLFYGRGRLDRARSVIAAQKLRNSLTTDEILKAYLNTMYFGRGAWGVQAASQAYFHVDVPKLTVAQGAVLAALLDDPTHGDPVNDEATAKRRWNSVLDAMVKKDFLSSADRKALVYPVVNVRPAPTGSWRAGATGVLGNRIERELESTVGLTAQQINTGGYIVRTTIDPTFQSALESSVRAALKGHRELEGSAVVIDPSTGAVRAYYGGDRGYGNLDLASSQAPRPAGPSFEPLVVAAAVSAGYRADSLAAAVRQSSASVFSKLTTTVGPSRVATVARAAGIRQLDGRPVDQAKVDPAIGLGRYSVSTIDQASAYATVANYGGYHEPYFVASVLDPAGRVVWDHESHSPAPGTAWPKDVGRDVSSVLQQEYQADPAVRIDRPAAVKTGGQHYGGTSDSWLGGYTPQLAAAIWVGTTDTKPVPPAERSAGRIDVRGAGVPGVIWRAFMPKALRGAPVERFLPAAGVGTKGAPR